VIGRQDKEVALAQRREQIGKPSIEILEAAVEIQRVVAVAPEHVGLHEIREDEALVELAEQPLRPRDPLDV
jgi:hypothetical protein